MIRTFLISILLISPMVINAQSNCDICDVLKLIKLEDIPENLKDSILVHTSYYPESNDPDYIEHYSLDLDTLERQARIEFGFESGQSLYVINEIKLFEKADSSFKVVHFRYVGTLATLDQQKFSIYDYHTVSKQLVIDEQSDHLFRIELKDFFKTNTPDSVLTKVESHTGVVYSLFYDEITNMEFRLRNFLIADDLNENKYLLGDVIRFKWMDNKFVRFEPHFDE